MANEEKVLPDPIEIEGIRIGDDRFKIKNKLDLNRKPDSEIGLGSIARSSDPEQPAIAENSDGYAFGIDAEADLYSFALGYGAKAKGTSSFVHGVYTYSDDIAAYNIASGTGSASFNGADAAADYSFACNRGKAGIYGLGGEYSFACGNSISNGDYSHAEGYDCNSNGIGSHAEGYDCIAAGDYSHAEGYGCTTAGGSVSKGYSHAEGYQSRADGNGSHVEGYQSQAYGHRSHVEGYKCISYSADSHVEGEGSTVGFKKYKNKNSGPCHAEGKNSLAWNGGHAEGYKSEAYGYSHAEGEYCIAGQEPDDVNDTYNHSYCAHAQGSGCVASGDYSFAGGQNCTARRENSVALGLNLLSCMRCQTVIGMYNDPDDPRGEAFCIGNGSVIGGESSSGNFSKKNCFMVDYAGNVWTGGKITCGSRGTVVLSSDLDNYYKKDEVVNNLTPSVTADDNGKILMVVDGKWAASMITNAEEVAY